MCRPMLCLAALLLGAPAALGQPLGNEKPDPLFVASAAMVEAHDKNRDNRLNADECPGVFRDRFAAVDLNHDGYLVSGEIMVALARRPIVRGRAVAQSIYVVADGALAEVYHNGKPVPLDARGIMKEDDGATAERIDIDVREGDWIVFQVGSNRLRRDRDPSITVVGDLPGKPGFVSNLTTGGWSSNDDPSQAAAFIDNPEFNFRGVSPPQRRWAGGDALMKDMLHRDWGGTAVWGQAPSTWIKYVAPRFSAEAGEKPRTAPGPTGGLPPGFSTEGTRP